jgi:hypothetical protein
MSWTPEDSAITLNAKQEAHLATLTNSEELKAYLAQVALDQQLVAPDPLFRNGMVYATDKADHARQQPQFTKTVIFNGVKHELVAASEVDLLAKENAVYRAGIEPTTTQQTEQPRNDRGQFTTAELDLQFRTGQIDGRTYLERSGIDVDALPQTSDRQFQQSWADATEEFLHSDAGATWPGGLKNRDLLGKIIQSNGLLDAEDKVAAMAEAYAFAKANNLLVDDQGIPLGGRAQIDQLYADTAKSGTPPTAADIRYAMGDRSSIFGAR